MPKRLTFQQVEAKLRKRGYTLLSTVYVNSWQRLEVVCEKGHKKTTTLNQLSKTQKCYLCVADQNRFSLGYVENIFKQRGLLLLSKEYTGARNKVEVMCPRGHVWGITLNKFSAGRNCPHCSLAGGNSKSECEIYDIIKSLYPNAKKMRVRNIKMEDKPYITGFDIDIFIPDLNKGVEFDGTYYHSFEVLKKGRPNWPLEDLDRYHFIKDHYFRSKGIDILHIKEENWEKNKRASIKTILLFLGQQ